VQGHSNAPVRRGNRNGYVALWLIVAALCAILPACGSRSSSSSSSSAAPPQIFATLITFPTGGVPPGFVPAGFNTGAAVEVLDNSGGVPIANASVSINGTPLAYSAANQEYEGNLAVAPGSSVTLNVNVGGTTYTASATQFTSYPAISAPSPAATWASYTANLVTWSDGAPIKGAAYALGVLDSADPSSRLVWPSGNSLQVVPTSTHSFSIGPYSLTAGNRLLIVGIASLVDVPNAAPNSGVVISGFNYVPVTVTNGSTATLLSIAVTPQSPTIAKGTTRQLTAIGTYSDSSRQDLTNQVTWASSDTSKATISSTGLATGMDFGSVTITATLGSVFGSTSLNVVALLSIAVTPQGPTIAKGQTQQLGATGTYSDNSTQDLTTQVTWTSSDTSNATVGNSGLVTGLGIGTATITATSGSVSGSTSIRGVAGFLPGVNYPTTSSLGDTAVGDLNGDGRNDVAVLEQFGTRIQVYYQNAGGTFDPPQVIPTDLNLKGIAIGDVSNDGLADLIVSGNSWTATSGFLGRIAVFRQDNVTHALGAPQEYTLSTNNVGPLAVADLNGDSLPDVVSAGMGSGSNGVISLLFQGVGGVLGPELTYTDVPVMVDGEVHVADMNHDGSNDIVLQSGYKQLAVIKQISPGIFTSTPDFYTVQTNYWPLFSSFALADLNGDGRVDVAVADLTGNLNIFYQDANGILTGPTILLNHGGPSELKVADLDGDGLNDIVLLEFGNTVRILYQSTNHSFPNHLTYVVPTRTTGGTLVHQALSVGDVTSDGLPDIVFSWSNEGIFVLPRMP